jgi:hypothetical protein
MTSITNKNEKQRVCRNLCGAMAEVAELSDFSSKDNSLNDTKSLPGMLNFIFYWFDNIYRQQPGSGTAERGAHRGGSNARRGGRGRPRRFQAGRGREDPREEALKKILATGAWGNAKFVQH